MQREPFTVAGYRVRTTNENQQAMQDIGALWGQVLSEQLLEKIPHRVGPEIFAVYYDYAGDYTKPYTCLIGVAVTEADHLSTGVTAITIPT